ncbi:hypothetical protein EI77_02838 [Prosthecobacter fusiformis]|uniref:Uncharacterized protein n=1 Tax=Prosthecobacter fusiformis TaxID=48464 RepID=A0A4R7RZF1_9BACT|nr:hypothetical protein [Prosthecobacter fusiformis]TDU70789.1 hypothetical protein EI77_02838 [Prosthecobacter fusiformis]
MTSDASPLTMVSRHVKRLLRTPWFQPEGSEFEQCDTFLETTEGYVWRIFDPDWSGPPMTAGEVGCLQLVEDSLEDHVSSEVRKLIIGSEIVAVSDQTIFGSMGIVLSTGVMVGMNIYCSRIGWDAILLSELEKEYLDEMVTVAGRLPI